MTEETPRCSRTRGMVLAGYIGDKSVVYKEKGIIIAGMECSHIQGVDKGCSMVMKFKLIYFRWLGAL